MGRHGEELWVLAFRVDEAFSGGASVDLFMYY